MDYQETIKYLYNATPQFERIGAAAYKPGLDTSRALDNAWGNPHRRYPIIHVAGTNGKGSTCHTLAAILQSQGYRTGLYTSPHLIDFRERMRVDGKMISEEEVVDFVRRYREMNLGLSPSFFELTTIMAFDFFARRGVDIAVVETGLGGRLDTTNIVTPILSVITNISRDHMVQLGDTPAQIAIEKAGIIKPGVPVVIGNATGEGVKEVFDAKAAQEGAPIHYAADHSWFPSAEYRGDHIIYHDTIAGKIIGGLSGDCQLENTATILCAVETLRGEGLTIDNHAIRHGFTRVMELTGLAGRWNKLCDKPLTICDTGHNEGGWRYLAPRLEKFGDSLVMVIGFVNDKDISHILDMMPKQARYIFTQAAIPRSMSAHTLAGQAEAAGLKGITIPDVSDALKEARAIAGENENGVIFIGGSTYVVAEA
ncbi:MAG: bifunctional folylpolyglutamate synthase/dihydrofolate synthase, partial [Muribaculaceae bacterium]|nr:bifunctional folylpolyglutamate synthase/dihydrofolate synthase [Muribaculaceae bacterium]